MHVRRYYAIRVINSCRESHVRKAFANDICTLPLAPRSSARPDRYVISRPYITIDTILLWRGVVLVSQKRLVARRIRLDRRWVDGVRVGGR
jgi:hypothetical protein